MTRITSLLFIASFLGNLAFAQSPSLSGILKDAENKSALGGATVKLTRGQDSVLVITDRSGKFEFTVKDTGSYSLSSSFSGFESLSMQVKLDYKRLNLGEILLNKEAKTLSNVTVVGTPAPVRQKADTTEYNASQFKVNPDATSEDLIKKTPGITVENGQVKVGGEQVRKVTVDGRDFFGDDASATLRNLPAEVVDKIQVFDRLSDQAQFTGVDDGNAAKSINIVTKANMRNGQFGRLFAGFGTDNHYLVGGNVSIFKDQRRISIVGLTNDVNQQNFAEMDLLGVTSSGGGGGFRGGGGRGGGFGGWGGGGGFLIGQQPGISRTNSLGLNYNDKWGKTFDVSGSYFFNNRRLENDEQLARQYFLNSDSIQYYDQGTLSQNNNYNHRANFRFDYKIDSSNSILITPSVNLQRYVSSSNVNGLTYFDLDDPISSTENRTESERRATNFNNNILYRHSFPKRGRTFSLNLNMGINNNNSDTYTNAFTTYFKGTTTVNDSVQTLRDQKTKGYNIGGSLNYTEPIGKKNAILEFRYNPSYNSSESDQRTYHLDAITEKYSEFDTSLSNVFESSYLAHRGGINYRKGDRNNQVSFGLDIQSATLNSERIFPYVTTVKKTFTNLLPNAQINFPLSKRENIRLFYRANTNAPSVTQLQDVIDNSNPLFISTGNPDLRQQYGHRLGLRYQFTNTQKGTSLFANVFGSSASDYVTTATFVAQNDSVLTPSVILYKGSQLSKPVNLDGQWNLNTFVTFGMPLKAIKTNMNLNAGFTYSRIPGLVNGESVFSNSYVFNTGVVFASNISQYVDFTVSYNASFNNAENTNQSSQDYFMHNAGLKLNLLSKSGWTFTNHITNQMYDGLSGGFNQNYWLWNMAAGKKFLKNDRAEFRLSVFDLLSQNQSIQRTVNERYLEDVTTLVLKQYFMLTFTYNLKNFGTPPSRQNNDRQFPQRRY